MVIRKENGEIVTIDFRETAPSKAYRDMFLDSEGNVIPKMSWNTALAAGVPGSVDGLGHAHKLYGILPWESVMQPAIKLAEDGYILNYSNILSLEAYKKYLSQDPITKSIFTSKRGFFGVSQLFKQPELASTLNRIQINGPREFYEGLTAQYIVNCMERTGGIITLEDLKNYKSILRNPITFKYRDFTIHSMPPPSSGGIALAGILNQVENIDLDTVNYHSSKHVQILTEVERNVYADRAHYLGDMDFIKVPIDQLISQEYANSRWDMISFLKAGQSKNINHGEVNTNIRESEETTHYSVTDKWGNAVSVTTTINGMFGNGITVDSAGFLLNNEMDDFSSKPGIPNAYGLIGAEANAIHPGKRMLSSMTPTIVEDPHGELFLVIGSPGGSTIITTVAQIIMNIIDYNMTIEESVENSRIHHQWLPDVIFYEWGSIGMLDRMELNALGYNIKRRRSIGEANCIQFDVKTGVYYASGDSRRRASAKAY